MPVYVYRCATCGQEVDKVVPSDQRDQPQVCPSCGSVMVRNPTHEEPAKTPEKWKP
jgi:putative FmdB family regulatory protein